MGGSCSLKCLPGFSSVFCVDSMRITYFSKSPAGVSVGVDCCLSLDGPMMNSATDSSWDTLQDSSCPGCRINSAYAAP